MAAGLTAQVGEEGGEDPGLELRSRMACDSPHGTGPDTGSGVPSFALPLLAVGVCAASVTPTASSGSFSKSSPAGVWAQRSSPPAGSWARFA